VHCANGHAEGLQPTLPSAPARLVKGCEHVEQGKRGDRRKEMKSKGDMRVVMIIQPKNSIKKG
jgi:hypothetical protein